MCQTNCFGCSLVSVWIWFSTSHALINLTENIRQALDEGYIGCGIFADLQKAFAAVDHEILLSTLDYYGICGISKNWFKFYLSNRKQFVSINGYDSGLPEINCGVPQGSVIGPLLFLLYIKDLNQAIKFCKVHHFVDDTDLLYSGKSIKKLNKLVNFDLKNLLYWLNANKISLNIKKTELVIFRSTRKQFDGEIKLKLSRKRLFPTDVIKYLGLKIDGNLSRKYHIDYLSVKLNRANKLLSKIRNLANSSILRTLYFAIFESHLNYCSLGRSQNCNAINSLVILQRKPLRIINFEPHNSHSSPLSNKSFILKFLDKVNLENTLSVSKSINNLLPSLFNDWYLFSPDQHNYETS